MPWLNLEQGSEEWLSARVGRITGSRFKDARDRSSGLTKQQAAYVAAKKAGGSDDEACTIAGYKKPPTSEAVADAIKNGIQLQWGGSAISYAMDTARDRCGGRTPSKFETAAMRTGKEQEPYARAKYEAKTGYLVEEVGIYVTEDGLLGISPDGLINDDGVLEIKSIISSAVLFQVLADEDISEYIDQCIGYLFLLNRQWVDLVLFVPDMDHIKIIRINRDEEAIDALARDLVDFANMVKTYEAALLKAMGKSDEQAKAEGVTL